MDWSINGLQQLLKYSTYAFIAWVSSWILFFLLLPLMITIFGKVKGAAVNYGISWASMVFIIIGLELYNKKEDYDTYIDTL
jgi:uncharacterized membrane protein